MKFSSLPLSIASVFRNAALTGALIAMQVCSTASFGAVLYWDGNGSTAGAGNEPSGNWGITALWSANSGGTIAPGTINTTVRDDLFFSAGTDATGAYAVTVTGTQGARYIGMQEGSVTLTGGTINLAYSGGGVISAATAGNTTINSNLNIGGSQTFNISSGQILTLGSGTFTRNAGGTLNIQGAGTVTSTQSNLSANNAAGLVGTWATHGINSQTRFATFTGSNITGLTGTAATDASGLNSVTLGNYDLAAATGTTPASVAANTIRYTGAAGTTTLGTSFSTNGLMNVGGGAWTLTGNTLTIGAERDLVVHTVTNNITIASAIQDNTIGAPSSLTKSGASNLTLSGNNTYTGITYVSQGILNISHANALGTTAGHTIINSNGSGSAGGILSLGGGITINENITIEGVGDGGRHNPEDSATAQYTAAVTSSSGNNTINGIITLSGNVGYRIGAGGGSTLNVGLIQRVGTENATLILSPSGGGTLNITQAIKNNNGGMIAHGGGTVILSASNNEIGDTTLQNNTTIRIAANNALGIIRNLQVGNSLGNTNTGSGNDVGTLFLEGISQTINSLNGYANGGTTLPNNATATDRRKITSSSASNSTLSVGNNGGSGSFDGVIEDGTGGGKTAFTKLGVGTQTLTGTIANTYTGDTTVSGGILALAKTAGVNAIAGNIVIGDGTGADILRLTNSDQIANTSIIRFNGTGSNAGVFRMNNQNETIGGLSSTGGAGIVENEFGAAGAAISALTIDVAASTTQSFSGILRDGDGQGTAGTDGTLSLTKTGSGAQVLSGSSTYTGGTTVSAGSLRVNNGTTGSATGSGPIMVATAGTFGGAGRIALDAANRATIQGTLSPGTALGAIGNLEINIASATGAATSGVTFSNATLAFELGAAGSSISSTGISDSLSLTGTLNEATDLTFTGSNVFNFGGTGAFGWYKLVDALTTTTFNWSGLTVDSTTREITGGLSITGLTAGHTGTLYLGNGSIGDHGDIYLRVVPEPQRSLLVMSGLCLLALRRRRK